MQAHTGFILLRNCYPFLSSTFASEFPSVALLVFPLFSFQCAVRRCKLRLFRFRVQPCGFPRKLHIAMLHLLFKSKPSLRFDLGRGFFSVSSNFKPTKCLKFEGDKLPGPTKKLRFAGLRVLRAIRSGPFGGLKWTRTTDLTIISRVL